KVKIEAMRVGTRVENIRQCVAIQVDELDIAVTQIHSRRVSQQGYDSTAGIKRHVIEGCSWQCGLSVRSYLSNRAKEGKGLDLRNGCISDVVTPYECACHAHLD